MIYTQYSRIKHHTLTTDTDFNVPPSEDFTSNDPLLRWDATDLALSEIGVNSERKEVYIRTDDSIKEVQTNFFINDTTLPSGGNNTIFTLDMTKYTVCLIDAIIIASNEPEAYSGKYSFTLNSQPFSPFTFSEVGTTTSTEKTTDTNYFATGLFTWAQSGHNVILRINEINPNVSRWTIRINILGIRN